MFLTRLIVLHFNGIGADGNCTGILLYSVFFFFFTYLSSAEHKNSNLDVRKIGS